MGLSGQQRKQLQSALIDAFLSQTSLERMLDNELDKNLRAIAGEGSLQDTVFKLIQTANAEGWIEDLVSAARDERPGNALLQAIADELLSNQTTPCLLNLKTGMISDSSLIDELAEILTRDDELFWRYIKQVYQDFLLQLEDVNDSGDEPNSLEEIFEKLQDYNEQIVILEFITRLIAYLSIKNKISYQETLNKIEKLLKVNNIKFKVTQSDYKQVLKRFKKEYEQSLSQVYLIVSIQESCSYPNTFQIYGWLATDEIIKNPELDFIQLDNEYLDSQLEDKQVIENSFTLEKIKEIFRNYRLQINYTREVGKIIVELFLPSSLLWWDIDKWEVELEPRILWESLCEVRIRSLDRLKLKYRDRNKLWKKKWELVQSCLSPLPQFLESHSNGNVNTLVGRLQNEKILGLKLTSALNSGHEGIASALYYSGTPIAVWLRHEPSKGDCVTQLNSLLQAHLLQLSERVLHERCQLECHISLIWDDPNRLIPHYQLQ